MEAKINQKVCSVTTITHQNIKHHTQYFRIPSNAYTATYTS